MSPQVDKYVLHPNISVREVMATKIVNCISDPFRIFRAFNKKDLFNTIVQAEVMTFSEAKHNVLRETLSGFPGIGVIAARGIVESNVTSTGPAFKVSAKSDSVRERSRFSLPITLIIWFITFYYAFNPNFRSDFTLAINGQKVPKFTSEVFKRTRSGLCGIFRVELGFNVTEAIKFISQNSEFKNTFLDPNFLGSPTGIRSVVTFFQYLSLAEGNYIPMVLADLRSLPTSESSYTITYTCLTVDLQRFKTNLGSIFMLGGNSYGQRVPSTHLADAYYTHQSIRNQGTIKDTYKYNSTLVSSAMEYEIVGSLLGISGYIMARVTSIEPNPDWFNTEPMVGRPESNTEKSEAITFKRTGKGKRFRKGDTAIASSQTPEKILTEFIDMANQFIRYIYLKQTGERLDPNYGIYFARS